MFTPLNLSNEEFRANAEMYMQKMGNVDPLTLTVLDQEAYQNIINTIYKDAMNVVVIVVAGLMVIGAVFAILLKNAKKQN